jgi:hypothetical protein
LGDGGGSGDPEDNGQDSTSLLGSMLRIDVRSLPYQIPADNPFISDPMIPDEKWSIGWRNPWRFYMDMPTGNLFVGDVGQNEMEEINLESTTEGGRNYGWNCYEGTQAYDLTDCGDASLYTPPIYAYNHSLGRSVTGGVVYRGSKYPNLSGKYIFTDFINSDIWWVLTMNGDKVSIVDTLFYSGEDILFQVATIGTDAAGEMYVAEFGTGELFTINATVLPVVLEGFQGTGHEGYNELFWTTTSEVDFDFFEIERENRNGVFVVLGKVGGKGNASESSNYTFKDRFPIPISRYRLKMVDMDGSFRYSELATVRQKIENNYQLFPNPVNDQLTVFNYGRLPTDYVLISESGLVVREEKNNDNFSIRISTKELTSGVYFLHTISINGEHRVRSFVVAH